QIRGLRRGSWPGGRFVASSIWFPWIWTSCPAGSRRFGENDIAGRRIRLNITVARHGGGEQRESAAHRHLSAANRQEDGAQAEPARENQRVAHLSRDLS